MVKWHPVRYGEAPTVADQRFSNSAYELTEWYLYANGWALRVRTDLSGGVLYAVSSVRLMRRNPHWLTGDPPGFEVHGAEVPESQWAGGVGFTGTGTPVVWFDANGKGPEHLDPEGFRVLSAAVSRLDPRPDE